MKKIIVVLLAGFFLITNSLTITVNANDNCEFSIKSMGCNPEQPVKNSRINFWVFVSVEGENPCVDVQGWLDGEPIRVSGNMGDLILVHLIVDSQKCYFPIVWPNDDKAHKLKFQVDVLNHYDEANEADNIFEKTLTASNSNRNQPPTKPICNYEKNTGKIIARSTDPNPTDMIRYGVSWNNNRNVDQWTNYHDSNEKVTINCEGKEGTFGIIAQDDKGAFSACTSISSNNNIQKFPILSKIIEKYPNAFPILRCILNI
jgi:hypothetical protein